MIDIADEKKLLKIINISKYSVSLYEIDVYVSADNIEDALDCCMVPNEDSGR